MKRIASDIFLEAPGPDLEGLSRLAAEFRAVLDARLAGDPREVADAVGAAAKVGAWGVTVAAHDPAAAEAGAGVRLVGTIEPLSACPDAWLRNRRTFESYEQHVRAAALRCAAAGFYGLRVRALEATLVGRSAPALRVFSRAAARPQPFSVRLARDSRRLATPVDLLDRGVHHPTTDPVRARCPDVESAALLLYAAIRRRAEAPGAPPPLLPGVWDEPGEDEGSSNRRRVSKEELDRR